MGSIHQIQEAFKFINELNKAQTNIQMITGMNSESVQKLTADYSKLAGTLHETTSSIMQASEEFLRAGHNQEATMTLLKASTVMSKIAGQDQKSTADQLIAITNGFKYSADETMAVVDKLTTVDNMSATSTKELGTALERTSVSAQMAGSSFEQVVSWIATVSSVSRKSASSIGESFKTIFSRYQDVKGGKDFDADGEAVSNVERDLKKYADINIRETSGEFKDFNVVIKDLSKSWNGLSEVSQSAIAKALAGTRQRENLLILMNNMDKALQLETAQLNSAGSAMDRYGTYAESTEAKFNDLKNALQQIWMKLISSEAINSAITGLTNFITTIDRVATGLGGLGSALTVLIPIIAVKFLSSLISITTIEGILTVTTVSLTAAIEGLGTAMIALLENPITWIIAAIGLVVVGLVTWVNHTQKVKEANEQMAKSQTEFNKAIEEFHKTLDPSKINEATKSLEEMKKALNYDETVKQIQKLKSEISTIEGKKLDFQDESLMEKKNQLDKLQNSIKDVQKEEERLNHEKELSAAIDFKSQQQQIVKIGNNLKEIDSDKQLLEKYEQSVSTGKEDIAVRDQILAKYPQYLQRLGEHGDKLGINTKALGKNLTAQEALAKAEVIEAQVAMRASIQKTEEMINDTLKRISAIKAERKLLTGADDADNTYDFTKTPDNQGGDLFSRTLTGLLSVKKNSDEVQSKNKKLYEDALNEEKNLEKLKVTKGQQEAFINMSAEDLLNAYNKSNGSSYIPPNDKDKKSKGSAYPSDLRSNETLLEKDRYVQLNIELQKYNSLVEEGKALQEDTDLETKNKLLAKETELLKQKQKVIGDMGQKENNIARELRSERNDKEYTLSLYGSTFSGEGDSKFVSNYSDIEAKLRNRADSLKNYKNDAQQTAYQNAKQEWQDYTDAFKRFNDIQTNELPARKKDWLELSNQIRKNNEEIQSNKIDLLLTSQDKALSPLKDEIKELEHSYSKLGKNNADLKIQNITSQLINGKNQAKLLREQINQLNDEFNATKDEKSKERIKSEMDGKVSELNSVESFLIDKAKQRAEDLIQPNRDKIAEYQNQISLLGNIDTPEEKSKVEELSKKIQEERQKINKIGTNWITETSSRRSSDEEKGTANALRDILKDNAIEMVNGTEDITSKSVENITAKYTQANEDISNSLKLVEGEYSKLSENDFTGRQSNLASQTKLVTDQFNNQKQALNDLLGVTDENTKSSKDYKDAVATAKENVSGLSDKLWELFQASQQNDLEQAKRQVDSFNESLEKLSGNTEALNQQMELLDTWQGGNNSAKSALYSSIISSTKAEISELQSQEKIYLQNREDARMAGEVDLMNYWNEQLENTYAKEKQLILENSKTRKSELESEFKEQYKQVESILFNGSTAKDDRDRIEALKKEQSDFISGNEKSYELDKLKLELARYNNDVFNTKLDMYDDEIAKLEKANKISRDDLSILQKQIAVKQKEMELEQLKQDRSVRVLKKQEDGRYKFVQEVDQTKINEVQSELDSAKIDLETTQKNVLISQQEEILSQKESFLQELSDIQSRVLSGEITSQEQFNSEMSVLYGKLDGKYSQMWSNIQLTQSNASTLLNKSWTDIKGYFQTFSVDMANYSGQLAQAITNSSNSTLSAVNSLYEAMFRLQQLKIAMGMASGNTLNDIALAAGYKANPGEGQGNAAFVMATQMSLKGHANGILGGMVDTTEPRMLHGTKSRPEAVLNYDQISTLLKNITTLTMPQITYTVPSYPSLNNSSSSNNTENFNVQNITIATNDAQGLFSQLKHVIRSKS